MKQRFSLQLLLLTTMAILTLESGMVLAQTAATPSVTAPTASTQSPGGISPRPSILTPTVGSPGSALGTIYQNLGIPLSVGGIVGLGTISTCTADIASPNASLPVDVTDPTATGTFSVSETTAGCGIVPPPSSPGPIGGSAFSSSTVPLADSEAGSSGLSPLIAVPDPSNPPMD
jgi:hypothetical protein